MIDIEKDIHPLTDFKRKTPEFRERLKSSDSPIILTVDGRPEMVLQNAKAYQGMLREIDRLKTERLKAEVKKGFDEVEQGKYTEYSDETLDQLFDEIEGDSLS